MYHKSVDIILVCISKTAASPTLSIDVTRDVTKLGAKILASAISKDETKHHTQTLTSAITIAAEQFSVHVTKTQTIPHQQISTQTDLIPDSNPRTNNTSTAAAVTSSNDETYNSFNFYKLKLNVKW